jgi:hypothetical protein
MKNHECTRSAQKQECHAAMGMMWRSDLGGRWKTTFDPSLWRTIWQRAFARNHGHGSRSCSSYHDKKFEQENFILDF